MTFPALMLLAVWVMSNIFDSPDVREDLIKLIIDNLPVQETRGRQEITKLLNGLTSGAGSLGILTVAILIYSASAAIGAMRHAVETANENEADGPSFPKNKGFDILITVATLPLALVFLGLIISRPLNSLIDDSTFLSGFAGTFGGPLGIGAFGVIFFTWMFWVLNPGRTPWPSTVVGAAVAAFLVGLVTFGLRLWFGFSGGGSAVYGVLTGFIGLLIFVNLASMGIVYGAHVAATFRMKPWRPGFPGSRRLM